MSSYRLVRNTRNEEIVLARAKWCQSFWCHFRGLQFVSSLPDDEGLLFVTGSESVVNTTIHMLFMSMEIGVVWLNAYGRIVDMKLAKPWRLAYPPTAPAKYYIEANPTILEKVRIGDVLNFGEVVK